MTGESTGHPRLLKVDAYVTTQGQGHTLSLRLGPRPVHVLTVCVILTVGRAEGAGALRDVLHTPGSVLGPVHRPGPHGWVGRDRVVSVETGK